MTDLITTRAELDALPFPSAVTLHGADWHKRRDGFWMCDDGDILTAGGLARFAGRCGVALVLAPSVAPEAPLDALDALVKVAKVGLPLEERRMVDEHAAQIRAALTVPSMVSEAAVEAFKAAWHKADAEGRAGERVRDGLAAAIPHLTAQPAPEASREDVVGILVGLGAMSPDHGADAASRAALVADILLARFVITESGETWIIDDAAFEEAARSEHHAEGLLARYNMTRKEDR